MAYLPDTNQLAITDSGDDEVYYVGYDSQVIEDQCDLAAIGLLLLAIL